MAKKKNRFDKTRIGEVEEKKTEETADEAAKLGTEEKKAEVPTEKNESLEEKKSEDKKPEAIKTAEENKSETDKTEKSKSDKENAPKSEEKTESSPKIVNKKRKKKKSGFQKTVEYLCTKRRPLSFIVSVLSAALGVGCVAYAAYCAFNIDNVKSAIKGMWGIAYIANVGLYTLFSVLGVIFFGVLGLYRLMLCYFYGKTFKGDPEFFKERRFETIVFSLFAFVMAGAFAFVWSNDKINLPLLGGSLPLIIAWIYGIAGVLPVLERIICVPVARGAAKKDREEVPKKDEITEELEKAADDKAMKTLEKNKNNAAKGKDKKTDTEKPPRPESSEEVAKKYGKAAGRLADKFKEIDEEDDDDADE